VLQEREVSQGDWRRVMGRGLREEVEAFLRSEQKVEPGGGKMTKVLNSSRAKAGEDLAKYTGVQDEGYAMIYVDWEGARSYCEQLTQRERKAGRLPAGWKYALPTEAQWEYACRAGTREAVYGGDMKIVGEYNAPVLDRIAWYGGNSAVRYPGAGMYFRGNVVSSGGWKGMASAGGVCGPRMCGQKAANGWGLRDMIGNVWEWCGDWYGEYEAKEGGLTVDPRGPVQGVGRVVRGGCWHRSAAHCRAARRGKSAPGSRDLFMGFRPVLVPLP
jgi:formylglycine-generating enzyme required for sulfatase activity